MDPEQLNDYSFRISTDKLQHEFQCTICLNPIADCYITRCGHVYCRHCIEEAVNRHHRCPFCTQPLNEFKTDVFKNYHFNTLKKIIDDEKKKQNEKYLNKIFDKMVKMKEDRQGENLLMAPIQKTIVEKCQQALLHYRQHLLQLYANMREIQEKKLVLGLAGAKNNQQLREELQSTILGAIPSPVVSPEIITQSTDIEVLLPNKKTFRSTLKLAPIAPLTSILPFLENLCSEMNVRIKDKIPDKLTINNELRSLNEPVGTLAGKFIKIQGIPLEVNTYCFTWEWNKDKMTNFYNCKTCNVKWICENCNVLCHKEHTSVLQLKDHKPDWACCYCATKCQCQAYNKNSKIK